MKALTISRLPPILLIHLKRFSFHGPFTDKIDTAVVFPVTGLDLTRYMPAPLDPVIETQYAKAIGGAGLEKPPAPIYDLHAISNHFGSLSSGHCKSCTCTIFHSARADFARDPQIPLISRAKGTGTISTTARLGESQKLKSLRPTSPLIPFGIPSLPHPKLHQIPVG